MAEVNGTTAEARSRAVVDELRAIEDYEERLFHIISRGEKSPSLEDSAKLDKFKIDGCASDLWLVPEFKDGRVYYRADSNAHITKGFSNIVTTVFSGATPDEIIALDTEFLKEAGVTQLLSPNRANGLAAICKQIKLYAVVFKKMAEAGKTDATL